MIIVIRITSILLVCSFCASVFSIEVLVDEEIARRQTAVALNYCRAALHRIRRKPDKCVFLEEQQRILNNLNLSKIADPEVISLWDDLYEEIARIEEVHPDYSPINPGP